MSWLIYPSIKEHQAAQFLFIFCNVFQFEFGEK